MDPQMNRWIPKRTDDSLQYCSRCCLHLRCDIFYGASCVTYRQVNETHLDFFLCLPLTEWGIPSRLSIYRIAYNVNDRMSYSGWMLYCSEGFLCLQGSVWFWHFCFGERCFSPPQVDRGHVCDALLVSLLAVVVTVAGLEIWATTGYHLWTVTCLSICLLYQKCEAQIVSTVQYVLFMSLC